MRKVTQDETSPRKTPFSEPRFTTIFGDKTIGLVHRDQQPLWLQQIVDDFYFGEQIRDDNNFLATNFIFLMTFWQHN